MSSTCWLCGSGETRFLFEKQGRRLLRCEGCGLQRVDPMPTPEELDAYYRSAYDEGAYSFFAEESEVRRAVAESRLEAIEGYAGAGPWLDVGASTGEFVELASEAGVDSRGIELSPHAVERARERGLDVECSSAEDYRAPLSFAVVTAFDVLEHLLEPRAFVRLARSWLAPGGRLVLTLPNVDSAYARWLMGRHWFYYVPHEHLYYYDPTTVRRLLEEEGFVVHSIERCSKALTLRYAAENLRRLVPPLGGIAKTMVGVLPSSLATRRIPMYLGEMLVKAERP